jgi:hypothetical protein
LLRFALLAMAHSSRSIITAKGSSAASSVTAGAGVAVNRLFMELPDEDLEALKAVKKETAPGGSS